MAACRTKLQTEAKSNPKTAKLQKKVQEGHCEKRCEIQGGSQEMAVIAIFFPNGLLGGHFLQLCCFWIRLIKTVRKLIFYWTRTYLISQFIFGNICDCNCYTIMLKNLLNILLLTEKNRKSHEYTTHSFNIHNNFIKKIKLQLRGHLL